MSTKNEIISPSDLTFILQHPWSLTEGEWELSDADGLEKSLTYVIQRLKSAEKDGFNYIWKTPENEAIAVLGFYLIAPKKYETFFIASKHMDKHALKITGELKKILKEETMNYKGCSCRLYSVSNHPNQVRWFTFLGFTYMPDKNIGASKYFEYTSTYE